MNLYRTPKLGQSDLLYQSKLPAKKVNSYFLTAHEKLVILCGP